MGLCWKEVNEKIPSYAVRLNGDESALGKKVPLLWRRMQDWHCFEVSSWSTHEPDAGYALFFGTNDVTMVYRRYLRSRFIMVREGQESVNFWVTDIKQVPGQLKATGLMVPAHRFRPNRSAEHAPSLHEVKQKGHIVWV